MNYSMIRHTLGWIILFESMFFAVPLITAAVYGEWATAFLAFAISAAISLALGLACTARKPRDNTIYAKEGFVIVSLSWIVLSLFGSLPFSIFLAFEGITEYTAIDALFESVSGFTTTGSSIFNGVEWLPKSVLMWRSFTHWVGGMGVLVFIMAFLPLGGGQNLHIMRAESTGYDVSKLVPKMKNTAIILYAIYFVMTVILFITLLISKMSVFDALNTAFATAGTGGFGFKNDSFLSFSATQQIIVTVGMLLFSINFNSYYLMLRLKFKDAINSEVRAFILIVLTAITIITLNIYKTTGLSLGETIRHVSFTVASLISTTGFSTLDFNTWLPLAKTVLVILMFTGACAGSTAGGIKISRILILIKGMMRELGSIIHPKQVKRISIDDHPLDREVVRSVNAYFACYILMFTAALLLISFNGNGLVTNFTAVTATINNIGPGLDAVGPTSNFYGFSWFSKLVLSFCMLAGRLELFPMLILFSPSTYKRS